MKKFIIYVALLCAQIAICNAQKIVITEGTQQVESIIRTGQSTFVLGDEKKVIKAWEKQLKDYGKVQSSKGLYTISGAEVPGVTSKPGLIYSLTIKEKGGVRIWWAIDLGTSYVSSNTNASAYKAASQILTDFAIAVYRDDINEQIQEAEKALSKTVKEYEKQQKQGDDLKKAIDKNKQEKKNLEQKLVDNASELKQLEKDQEQNVKDQDKARSEVDKMKKAVAMVRSKLDDLGD